MDGRSYQQKKSKILSSQDLWLNSDEMGRVQSKQSGVCEVCRCINADHVIGATFWALLRQGISNTEIPLMDLVALEKALDRALRKNHTIVNMSIRDVYNTVDNYSGIFEISENAMRFKKREAWDHQKLLEMLYRCFRAGLPADIGETVDREVLIHLGVEDRAEE